MRLEMGTGFVRVVLSRRNILALLAKLDGFPQDSARTIYKDQPETPTLFVVAEEDPEHYAHPSREGEPAGPLHPDTEDRLR